MDSDTTLRAALFLDKGGTGKTTSAAHLGVAAAELGLEVLLIDLAGKQGDLSKQFGVWEDVREEIEAEDDWPNISTVFKDDWDRVVSALGAEEAVESLIKETDEGPDLIPAHPGLDGLDGELSQIDDVEDRYSRLDAFLDDMVDPLGYDLVLIDLPGLTNNITYNGIWAARAVVAPVEMGPFERDQAAQLEDDLETFNDVLPVEVEIAMVIANKYDQRTTLDEDYLEEFSEDYPDAMAPEPVPKSQDIRNAADGGTTSYGLEEPSSTAEAARDAFKANADELIQRLQKQQTND
jgi:chromosome partitioning protein